MLKRLLCSQGSYAAKAHRLLRLLGSYVPKAPRLPGAHAPKHPLLLRLLCSDTLVLFLYYVTLPCILKLFSLVVLFKDCPHGFD